jgi:hypothetical protein
MSFSSFLKYKIGEQESRTDPTCGRMGLVPGGRGDEVVKGYRRVNMV